MEAARARRNANAAAPPRRTAQARRRQPPVLVGSAAQRTGADQRPALVPALQRIETVRGLGIKLPRTHIPPSRIAALARFARTVKVSTVARVPEARRLTTLVAFAHNPKRVRTMTHSTCSTCCFASCSTARNRCPQ